MNYFFSYRSLCNRVKTLRVVLCLCALLSGSQAIHAQVYDTSAVAVEAPVEEDTENTEDTEPKITIPEPVVFRQVPDSTVRQLKKQKEFAYANDPAYWTREQKIEDEPRRKGFWDYFNGFFSGTAIRYITYGILIFFFLFVILRIILVNKLFLFYDSTKSKIAVTSEDIDIHDENLNEKIRNAVDAKEHRLAVRFMYLKALQLLNEKQWIRFHADATNYEYVNQMSGHKLASEFGFLTRVYDYMWYGEFALTEEQFDIVYKNFNNFYNALHS